MYVQANLLIFDKYVYIFQVPLVLLKGGKSDPYANKREPHLSGISLENILFSIDIFIYKQFLKITASLFNLCNIQETNH